MIIGQRFLGRHTLDNRGHKGLWTLLRIRAMYIVHEASPPRQSLVTLRLKIYFRLEDDVLPNWLGLERIG